MRYPVAMALCLSVAACAGQASNTSSEPSLRTDMIRDDLLQKRSALWKDPDSIRDARIGEAYACPRHGGFSGRPTTCVCLEVNAKNSMGGYTGLQKKVVVYRGVFVDHIKDWDFDDRCEGLVPFPELNGGYVPPRASRTSCQTEWSSHLVHRMYFSI